MVLPRVPGAAMMIAVGKEGGNALPLGIREFIAMHGWPPFENRPAGASIIIVRNHIVRKSLVPEQAFPPGS
jgi:hypothetical protein